MRHDEPESNLRAADDYERELHRLLDAAIDLPPEQVRPFLEKAAGSPELASEVEGLLREQTSSDDSLRPHLAGLVSRLADIAA